MRNRSGVPVPTSSTSGRSRSMTSSKRTCSRPMAPTTGLSRYRRAPPGNRWVCAPRREAGTPVVAHLLSLTPFRRIVKDYFMICDSYYQAIRTATPDKIEAIDMGRRGIHDEGSRTLQERLKGKVRVDFETARRLFTLITVLHWKGWDT